MNLHSNARLTVKSRADLVEAVTQEGLTLKRAAACFRVSERTAAKWLGRFRREGMAGLRDRSSRPHRHPKTTSGAAVAVVFENFLQLRPDWIVAFFVFLFGTGVDRHDEGLADFHDFLV